MINDVILYSDEDDHPIEDIMASRGNSQPGIQRRRGENFEKKNIFVRYVSPK